MGTMGRLLFVFGTIVWVLITLGILYFFGYIAWLISVLIIPIGMIVTINIMGLIAWIARGDKEKDEEPIKGW